MRRSDIAGRLAANSVPEPNTGCVLWLGVVDHGGYGQMRVGWNRRQVHRIAYALERGPIPLGMVVCHKCDQPSCLRHDHLFLGTQKDNMVDMAKKGRNHAQKKTHCPAGHAYSEDNTIIGTHKSRGQFRRCVICHNKSCDAENQRRRRAARTPEKKAADNAVAKIATIEYRRRKKAERALAAAAA